MKLIRSTLLSIVLLSAMTLTARGHAFAANESVLWSFGGPGDGANLQSAKNEVTTDGTNLFGTTYSGGANGLGTVYELTPNGSGGWNESVLWSFANNGVDGHGPRSGPIVDSLGNLYGTTYLGGAYGSGTVYELSPAGSGWIETILHSFGGSPSVPADPGAALMMDGAGNLYGTCTNGGGGGAAFELSSAGAGWTESTLWTPVKLTDGVNTLGGLIMDSLGNLYGTTLSGGASTGSKNFPFGAGTAYQLTPAGGTWTHSIITNFATNSRDVQRPNAALTMDSSGNLYSTSQTGGVSGKGTVFKLTPATGGGWTESVIWNFGSGKSDGSAPVGSLIIDASGKIFGTTPGGGAYGGGTAFSLNPPANAGGSWTETILWNFKGGADGSWPTANLAQLGGNLYGSTQAGGAHGAGTVFKLTNTGFTP